MGRTALWLAVDRCDPMAVHALLRHGADPEAPGPDGEVPLARAVVSDVSGEEIVPMLLNRGADPNAKCGNGSTPYTVARGICAASFPFLAEEALHRVGLHWTTSSASSGDSALR
eukprot:TRINITY_DN14638_c0_g1_i2.p4 TRINITY_DN14638_c0_g1~~TRINITY_DN14638_c0_g1_i2.p4  ORF type:complete len:114 (+),score=33.10 TRINITY_DN14638_c0_g1_i2:249-590(+)